MHQSAYPPSLGLEEIAQAVLAEHGLTGKLDALSGDRWVFRGERAGKGIAVEIEGEPDEALLREAARQMLEALAQERVGR
jgi:hypothetical protein